MDFLVTFMTADRAFSKAGSRLAAKLKELEESLSTVTLSSGAIDDVIVMLVDQPPEYFREIKNKDGVYQVEIGSPAVVSYRPADDEKLLLNIIGQVRTALAHAPISDTDRDELLSQMSAWEEQTRRRSLRVVPAECD
jgi:hypothetical protein